MTTTELWINRRPEYQFIENELQPIEVTEELFTPAEQIFFEMLKFNILERRDGYAHYVINDLTEMPFADDETFWGSNHNPKLDDYYVDDPYLNSNTNDDCGIMKTILGSISEWYTYIKYYFTINDDEITQDTKNEMLKFLKECSEDENESAIVSPNIRYNAQWCLLETSILMYIKCYYYARFRGPLIKWVEGMSGPK